MSEKRRSTDNSIMAIFKSSLILLLSIIALTIILSLIFSYVLLTTGSPEKYYKIANVLILFMPAFITGKIAVKRKLPSIFLTNTLAVIFYVIILTFLSLIFNPNNFNLSVLLSNFIIPFLASLLGAITTSEKKKRKKKK